MSGLRGFAVACHPAPTIGVTAITALLAWSIGWRGEALGLVALAVLLGQLSVGWGNDAFDSDHDRRAARAGKPTVTEDVSPRALWIGACVALAAAVALSWAVAGWLGGSFHVLALAMAWLYNLRLSRTSWSWLPYAVAFACAPPFLTFGLDGRAPPLWMVAAFAVIAVSAHVANALPDIADDRGSGLGGLAVRLGERRSVRLCWALLALGTGLVVVATAGRTPLAAAVVAVAFLGAAAVARRRERRDASFAALLANAANDVAAIAIIPAL
ncbi:MAG: UbiA family prenyltransferase [Gaiellales bacterium]